LTGAGLLASTDPLSASAQTSEKSRLVLVRHSGATDEHGDGQAESVARMLDRAMRELTGKDAPAEAWRTFVSPDDVVGLKINLRGGRYLSTQPCVVEAIVAGLLAAGVTANHIIVWDAWTREFAEAGFTVNTSDQGVRYFATDQRRAGSGREASDEALEPCYASEAIPVSDKSARFSKILTEEITALINVPLIKDHRIVGVTCAMKNHFGSIMRPSDLHANYCDPYLAELNATAPIKGKTRLVVVDGLRALCNGGPRDAPQWRWRPNCIMAGTDPVAVDSVALAIIEEKRREKGLDPIGKRAKYIATAAKLGLGTDDPARIDLREINVSSGV
jgi:uncharacterized protein (DUF362 family)